MGKLTKAQQWLGRSVLRSGVTNGEVVVQAIVFGVVEIAGLIWVWCKS